MANFLVFSFSRHLDTFFPDLSRNPFSTIHHPGCCCSRLKLKTSISQDQVLSLRAVGVAAAMMSSSDSREARLCQLNPEKLPSERESTYNIL